MFLPVDEFKEFKEHLGFSEGGGNYRAVYKDKNGVPKAFGKYQFIEARLKDVSRFMNIPEPSINVFLANRDLQDSFFYAHCLMIYNYIKENNLDTYIGSEVIGRNKYPVKTTINIYGLIGGSHLGGETGLKNFLVNGVDRRDALGTYISDYVAKFSDLMSEKKRTLNKLYSLALFALVML